MRAEKSSSLEKALTLLDAFTMDKPEKRVTDLATKLGIGKSTAHRLLSTLESEGFVTKDIRSRYYSLGVSILSLSSVVISNNKICQAAIPVLKSLVKLSGESAHVATLEKTRVVYLYKVDCEHPVRLRSHLGKENPAYCTSSGQVMLAFQPEEVVDQVIAEGLVPYTDKTITSPEKLKSLLKTIRETHVALSVEELHESVASIGAPIRDHHGNVVASVSVAGPVQRLTNYTIPKLTKLVKLAANEISVRLHSQD